MHIITTVFEEKSILTLEDKKGTLQKCCELLSCLKDVDDNDGRREMAHFKNENISKGDKNQPSWIQASLAH